MKIIRNTGIRTIIAVVIVLGIIYCLSLQDKKQKLKKTPKKKERRDFIDHPVVNDLLTPAATVTVRPRLNVYNKMQQRTNKENPCVSLTTFIGSTPICIFDPNVDKMISSYVRDYGTWEPDLLNETGIVLQQKPHLTFIDIGCNIGIFTLFNAKLGARVVAVDILEPALELVQRSLSLGGLKQNVTLLLNAVSDKRESVKVNFVNENPGGSYIQHNRTGGNYVDAILLDDILNVVKSGSVFLKMDIEGNEYKALTGGSMFFQVLNVEYILMEWMFHRHSLDGKEIIQFLLRNGMLPYETLSRNQPLNLGTPYHWPDNVFWCKR